jgi:phosphatidylethanolamine/phosphatidyl-N-methylethanolamine N-methyltransferase
MDNVQPQEKRGRMFFLRKYLQSPMGIGAVVPSSQKLALQMVKMLGAKPDEVVVELGPGTGIFTQALLTSGVRPQNLILVEFDLEFVEYLRHAFPLVRVLQGDASQLRALLNRVDDRPVYRVLSGIPLRSMKPAIRAAIAQAISEVLQPGGVLVQFSYFNASPIVRSVADKVGLIGQKAGMIMANMPPAFVWKYVRQI